VAFAAVGAAGIQLPDISAVSIYLDNVLVVEAGQRSVRYDENQARQVMSKPEFTVRVDLGNGDASAFIWTCDLTHDYVRINADYRS